MISSVLFAPFRRFKMSDDEKREDRKRKADSKEETEKEEDESDSDDGEMIGPMPTEAAPTKKPKVRNRVGFWDVATTEWLIGAGG